MVPTREDAVDILVSKRAKVSEALPCLGIAQAQLAVLVASTNVDVSI